MLGPPSDPAAEHLARAQAAADEGRPDRVRDHVRAGLAVVEDEDLELRLRLTGVAWTAESEGHEAAMAALADLAERADRLGHPELVALCRAQTAYMHLRTGDLLAARDCLVAVDDSALADLDRTRVLLNRGTLAAHLDPGAGEEDLVRAARAARDADLPELLLRATHNLGWLAFLRGDLVEALRLMREADQVPVTVDRAVARLDRARVLLEAGLAREAQGVLREAESGAVASGQAQTAAEIGLELARTALLLRDRTGARERFRAAADGFTRTGSVPWADRARLQETALAVADGGDGSLDEAALRRLRDAAITHGDVVSEATSRLALVESALAVDRPALAEERLAALRPALGRRSPFVSTRLRVLGLRARAAYQCGDARRATALLRRASEELARARTRPASLDLRTAVAVHAQGLVELDLSIGLATGRPSSVLGRSEHWRAATDHLPAVRAAQPGSEDEEGRLMVRLRSAREDLRTAPPGADTTMLLTRARRAEQEVRELDWATADGEVTHVAPLSARALATTLEEQAYGLVSYVAHRGTLHAVVVPPGGRARLVPMGRLEAAADAVNRTRAGIRSLAGLRVPGPLEGAVRSSVTSDLADLAALLVGPAVAHLPRDVPLVVVPTRNLGNVPWAMLPGTRGRPLVVARSASAWAHAHRRAEGRTEAPPSVGGLAGPGLPLADEEVRRIEQLWTGAGRAGDTVAAARSCPRALRDLLARHAVVHVAAHGTHDQESPLFSSIRTAEGPAFAHELERDRVAARHVVLAACEGGRATPRPGDEPLGLSATLLAVGVTCVVAPTSLVPDEDAHALVLAHHRELALGVDSVTALARATEAAPLLAGSFTAFGAAWRPTSAGRLPHPRDGSRPAPS